MAPFLHYFLIQSLLSDLLFQAYATVPYDSSFTLECLKEPLTAQYQGGIVVNPELNQGLKGWTTFGDAKIEHRKSDLENKYIVASGRTQHYHSVRQIFHLEAGLIYAFSAWLQVSHGKANVAATLKTNTSYKTAGWVQAKVDCWSMLKGGFSVPNSGPAELYFETKNTGGHNHSDVFVDSISLQPFTLREWRNQQRQSVEKFRKSKVKFQAVDEHGKPVVNATVSLKQNQGHFPFGCAINSNILQNNLYQKWFLKRFRKRYTVFENELKWYSTEASQGKVDYSTADAMVQFAWSNKIKARGHNVFWADPNYQPQWVKGLWSNELRTAANKRMKSVMNKYKAKFIHWDVMNENLHFKFFEDRLGSPSASSDFYNLAHNIDPKTTMFLNDYNVIEYSKDCDSTPENYINRIETMKANGYSGTLGVGVEGHFSYRKPDLAYIKASLDKFFCAGYKVWITELDVAAGEHQSSYLGHILNELYSHPAVEGILLWAAWKANNGCYRMCLTDDDFNSLKTGKVVDKFIIKQLAGRKPSQSGSSLTDSNGFYEASLPHGDYRVMITNAEGQKVSESRRISVVPEEEGVSAEIHRFTVSAEN